MNELSKFDKADLKRLTRRARNNMNPGAHSNYATWNDSAAGTAFRLFWKKSLRPREIKELIAQAFAKTTAGQMVAARGGTL